MFFYQTFLCSPRPFFGQHHKQLKTLAFYTAQLTNESECSVCLCIEANVFCKNSLEDLIKEFEIFQNVGENFQI